MPVQQEEPVRLVSEAKSLILAVDIAAVLSLPVLTAEGERHRCLYRLGTYVAVALLLVSYDLMQPKGVVGCARCQDAVVAVWELWPVRYLVRLSAPVIK